MNPRWAGLFAPFRWLIDAVDVGRHQPQVVIGAILAVTLVGFLPSLPPQLMTFAGSPPGVSLQMLFQALAMAVGLFVSPVLVAGVYRLLENAERGRAVAVAQIADGFGDGSWAPVVLVTVLGYALMFVVALVMMLTMVAVTGIETLQALQQWLDQVMALQAQAQQSSGAVKPEAVPALPDGLGAMVAVFLAFTPLWTLIALGTSWALVSVALRRTPALAALLGGLRAAFVNAASVLAFGLALALPALFLLLLLGLVIAAVIALGNLMGALVGGVLTLAVMFVATAVVAAIGYGFVLNGWRAAVDDGGPLDAADGGEPPARITGIEA
jgi:MFS family permease